MNSDAIQAKRPNAQPLEAATLPNALLKMTTAAAVTSLSVHTLYKKARAGELKLTKLGARCTRVHAEDLRAFLAGLK